MRVGNSVYEYSYDTTTVLVLSSTADMSIRRVNLGPATTQFSASLLLLLTRVSVVVCTVALS